uniref:Uncharacterized protein n=1 Tax=Anguilla anguilla TaxID=7936 RepID=A0A0E9UER0_ANGAN
MRRLINKLQPLLTLRLMPLPANSDKKQAQCPVVFFSPVH